ncbi:hypothetical protein KY332_01485 [Candidatus Woesearchaeota archaeon]|nr:hypothetical protein [Candidatus Woesearchaeota archaeon]
MTFPQAKHFSDSRLKDNFNKKILNKLDREDDAYDRVEKDYLRIRHDIKFVRDRFNIKVPFISKLEKLFVKYRKSLLVVNPEASKKPNTEMIKKVRGKTCEACRKPKHLEEAHIIEKHNFRGIHRKYSAFKFHRANLFWICHDCHLDLDDKDPKKMNIRRINRLIKSMKRRQHQMVKELDKDAVKTRRMRKELDKIKKRLKITLARTLNQNARAIRL